MTTTRKKKSPKPQFRSNFEEILHKQLVKAKVSFQYESVKIPYSIEANYLPDFVLDNGIIIEAKGWFRIDAKRKMIAVKKKNPHLDIRFVFQGKKKSDIKFCEKYSFPWSVGSIPEEWIKE